MKKNIGKWLVAICGLILCVVTLFIINKSSHKADTPRAKYIFLFVADGMSHTHVSMTESYMSYKAGKVGGERLAFSSKSYTHRMDDKLSHWWRCASLCNR